jgi:hypothetical protein
MGRQGRRDASEARLPTCKVHSDISLEGSDVDGLGPFIVQSLSKESQRTACSTYRGIRQALT